MRALLIALIAALGVLAPALCLSGALPHACDDATTQQGCGHEDDCPADPCGGTALRPREANAVGGAGLGPPPCVPLALPPSFVACRHHVAMPPAHASGSSLARFPAPLPLRI